MQERLRQWEGVSVPLGLEEMLTQPQNSYPETGYAGLSSQGRHALSLTSRAAFSSKPLETKVLVPAARDIPSPR